MWQKLHALLSPISSSASLAITTARTSLGMALAPLAPYVLLIKIGLVLAGVGLIWYEGYSYGVSKVDKLKSTIATNNQTINTEAKVSEKEIVTVYKTKVVYRDKKSKEIDNQVKNGALKDESRACTIGPEFIRLHNYAASSETGSNSK